MIFFIESVVICVLFTLAILIPLAKNPVGQIMSFPEPIRRRVESLPQYQGSIKKTEKKHLSIKVLSVFVISLFTAVIAYISGARTFSNSFIYVFSLVMVVNLYDLIVLDLVIFIHCKRFWIPGTEDMVKEYHDPRHYIIGTLVGTVISAVIALLSAGLIHIANMLFL